MSREIVITGLGVVSPLGVGREAFWEQLQAGQSGIRPITAFDTSALQVKFGGQIVDFDPKLYVRPRKSLKVMSREIQMGFAAADLALVDAGLTAGSVEPDRFGVVFGSDMIYADVHDLESTYRRCSASGRFDFEQWGTAAMEELYPLWLLKLLPNMTASHIAIAHDARGPNNSIVLGDVSSMLAIAEAASVIERGWADVMITGGTGCRLDPTAIVARCEHDLSHQSDHPQRASRPFDLHRDGLVNGEGAGSVVIESLEHAVNRGARIYARLLSITARHEPVRGQQALTGSGLRAAIRGSLLKSGLEARDIGHVNAHGLSTVAMDRVEASAIAAELGSVPVTAPKASFGHLGAGGGTVELVASVLGLAEGIVPATLTYETPDPACPVNVVHGSPLSGRPRTAMKVNFASTGQAAAMVIAAPE
jgi:3-oxoacyl-[acyl-carrier-protein] synthase II